MHHMSLKSSRAQPGKTVSLGTTLFNQCHCCGSCPSTHLSLKVSPGVSLNRCTSSLVFATTPAVGPPSECAGRTSSWSVELVVLAFFSPEGGAAGPLSLSDKESLGVGWKMMPATEDVAGIICWHIIRLHGGWEKLRTGLHCFLESRGQAQVRECGK